MHDDEELGRLLCTEVTFEYMSLLVVVHLGVVYFEIVNQDNRFLLSI